MLEIFGAAKTPGETFNRRKLMQAGGLSLFGLTTPGFLKAKEQSSKRHPGKAKSVILFNLLGGPSHMDMFDMKPQAPAEVRGEFKPIATSLPGLQICEHLPNTAKWMHKTSLIRTITHNHNSHNPLPILTGYTDGNPAALSPDPNDPPDVGAVCQYLGIGPRNVPGAVCLPCYPGWGEGHRRPGTYGGFLGRQYDPVFSFCDPTFASEPKIKHYDPVLAMGDPFMPGLGNAVDMPAHRFENRKSLLTRLDLAYRKQVESASHINLDRHQQRAFELLTSSKTREAFDLSKEPEALRERYGRNLFGSSMLVARRLVEAGVPFISVHQEIFKHYGHSYDMHENNFGMLKNFNLPMLDKLLPALLQDLEERGLLDSTLVIVMGEMGRSPRVNGKAGREHWPQCGFSLLAGGGTKQGTVFGTTDKEAGYPVDHPVRPCDLIATIYHLLGIDPHTLIHDRIGRPFPIARGGDPVQGVIA